MTKKQLQNVLADTYARGVCAEAWLKLTCLDDMVDPCTQFDLCEMEPWYGMRMMVGGPNADVMWSLDAMIEYSRQGITMDELAEKEGYGSVIEMVADMRDSGASMMEAAMYDIISDCNLYSQYDKDIWQHVFYDDALEQIDMEELEWEDGCDATTQWFTFVVRDFVRYL